MTADAGLLTLFLLVLADSLGVPAPGDTALLAAGALAAEGHLPLIPVIAVGSVAAMIGDGVVYWVGRHGGRRIMERDGRLADRRRTALARADRLYADYGLLAVFCARFIPGVRAFSALAAGTARMPWPAFAVVNAAAIVVWSTVAALAGYALGPTFVIIVIAVVVTATLAFWLARYLRAGRATRRYREA